MNQRRFFTRDKYSALLKWADKSNKALFLEGPRQVGKTSLLLKLGKEIFDAYTYINLAERESAEHLERLIKAAHLRFGYAGEDEKRGPFWESVFKGIDPRYINSERVLIIIDEIQESAKVYSYIRQIRRSLKNKLSVTGSYLGLAKSKNDYWISAGDDMPVELSSLSYTEFLKANDIYDEYDEIRSFDQHKLTAMDKNIYERIRELYRVYCVIGGYPDVVQEWILNSDLDECKRMVQDLMNQFYNESSRYFDEIIGKNLWSRTLERVAADISAKTGSLDIELAKEEFRGSDSDGLQIHRKDKVNALKWLVDCKIVGVAGVYSKLDTVPVLGNKQLYFFRDMGVLSYFCSSSPLLLPSNFAGMLAENFVYIYLNEQLGTKFLEESVRSYQSSNEQIDFILHDPQRKRFGFEVKHKKGTTLSGDKALKQHRIDYLVRFQDTYGSVSGEQATIPIFAIDKLKYI